MGWGYSARHLASLGLAPTSVRVAMAPLKAALAEAAEDELIVANPAAGLRLGQAHAGPKVDEETEEKAKALDEDELRLLIAATSEPWKLLVETLACTGLRISEARALRWSDIDFGRRRVLVRRRLRGADDFDAPKSRYSRREVPLPPAMARRLWEARKAASDPQDEALIFTRDGAPVDRTAAYRAVRAAAKKAKVGEWVGLHSLRHSYASVLFSNGASAVQVQRLLGHHSPAFTLSVYVHLLPSDQLEPDYLDGLLAPEGVTRVSPRTAENGLDEASAETGQKVALAAIS